MKTEQFERKFDADEDDILDESNLSAISRPNQTQKSVNVDFPTGVVDSLDKEANREMLIVALDVYTFEEMKAIVESTKAEVTVYKVGLQLLTSEGPEVIRYLKSLGKTVFLDLKLHEIANSVASAIKAAAKHGVDMVTVHASGGQKMMEAAVEVASEYANMKVIALTVVTGLNDQDLLDIGFNRSSQDQVIRLAQLAERSGCHGVIASPQETKVLRTTLANHMLIITPGIRPQGGDLQDQHRVGTPAHAITSGASYIIVGRAIVQADDPEQSAREINEQIQLNLQRHSF